MMKQNNLTTITKMKMRFSNGKLVNKINKIKEWIKIIKITFKNNKILTINKNKMNFKIQINLKIFKTTMT